MNNTDQNIFTQQLADISARDLHRTLRLVESQQGPYISVNGRSLCNFSSNNYLGLANHPQVVAAVKKAMEKWGWGAGASQLITGHMIPHQQLADRLAKFKRTQAALVCSTGYQANLAAIRALAGKDDVILIDKLNHHSIIDAARGSEATLRVFPHRHYDKLQRLLERTANAGRRIIVTDSLFSMDGDMADLAQLVELKQRYDALLCIDEAHATGVFGENGRGIAELMGVEDKIDVVVGTLSKALGGIGGFIAASTEIIDWIVNTAGSFIYTTSLPPAACAAAMAALDIIEDEPDRREKLLDLADCLRHRLAEHTNYDTGGSTSQIVPIIVGESSQALRLAETLENEGFLIPAIRPPTVPLGKARLRISLCCQHTESDIDRLVEAL